MLKFLKYDSPRVVCPPGDLLTPNDTPHIIVASLMRTGTHLVIDLLLNNFPQYRNQTLYTDLDRYIGNGGNIADVEASGGMIHKTHFPQYPHCLDKKKAYIEFFKDKKVIITDRNKENTRRSLGNFGEMGKRKLARFDFHYEEFQQFWHSHPKVLCLRYEDLIQPEKMPKIMESICSFLELPYPDEPCYARQKQDRYRILFDKALTRLFGAKAPIINTGIQLNRTHTKFVLAVWGLLLCPLLKKTSEYLDY